MITSLMKKNTNDEKIFFPRLQGSKNASLPIIAAAVLTGKNITLHNVPRISDVENLKTILTKLGASIHWSGKNTLRIRTSQLKNSTIPNYLSAQSRGAMYAIIPAIYSFKKCKIGKIGGDKLKRSLALQKKLFNAFGLSTVIKKNGMEIRGFPTAARFSLSDKGITATSMSIMLASICTKKTVILNGSLEPEIDIVINFLRKLGTKITKKGRTITVEPRPFREKIIFEIPNDRLAIGTWILAAAATRKTIAFKRDWATAQIHVCFPIFKKMGIIIKETKKQIIFFTPLALKPVNVQVDMFPSFPSDLQPLLVTVLTTANGTSSITEKCYCDRFSHVISLRKMGAKITCIPRKITIEGPTPLRGITIYGKFGIRESTALLLAGMIAQGETRLTHWESLRRGYEPTFLKELLHSNKNIHSRSN